MDHATSTEPTTASEALTELLRRFEVLADLRQVSSLLSWDQNTYMPAGAAAARGQQLATLSELAHGRLTDPAVGDLIARVEDEGHPEGSVEAAMVRNARRSYDQATKLPTEFVASFAKLRSESQAAWVEARAANDFASFAPLLGRMFAMSREEAEYLGYEEHPYDALHDLYEAGSSAARLRSVFEPLRDETVALLRDIRERGSELDDELLHERWDEEVQEQFAVEVVKGFGYDFRHGRLDRTVHPFAQGIDRSDVRITTRYNPDYLSTALFGTLHEAGHGMYEQGIAERYARTPLGEAASLGVHESQSRLWENLVGRSYAFWQGAYPRLQELFPQQLGATPLDDFYAAVNVVRPSLIRVEADEVTYNLHVMVRFELEHALLEGSLEVRDLPEAWNERYRDYLGITPPDDARGCLQDVHWSFGLVGYFPTYALGNLMSVQLYEAAREALPDLEEKIRVGDFADLHGWMREHVHRHGARFEPDELLRRATGSGLDAAPYVRYLNRKYRALYGLD